MNRVFVIAASGLALAGCTSGSGTDWFPKFEPAPVSIQFQSEPAGAEAKTSTGGSCQTPCALSVPPDKEFSVTFSLAGYQPQSVPVQLTKPQGIETALQPNPVAVELAAAPEPRPRANQPGDPRPLPPREACGGQTRCAAPCCAAPCCRCSRTCRPRPCACRHCAGDGSLASGPLSSQDGQIC